MSGCATIPAGEDTATVRVDVVCEGGPAAGLTATVGVGRHVVGRARTAAITIADRSVEPHHLLLDVEAAGAVGVVQLSGRVPCRLDGSPLGVDRTAVAPGAVVHVGSSRLRIGTAPSRSAGAPAAGTDEPGAEPVVVPGAATSEMPRAKAAWLGLVALAALAASFVGPAALVALVAGGTVAAAAAWAGRCARRQADTERRQLDQLARQLDRGRSEWLEAARARTPGVAEVVAMVTADPVRCWSRTDGDGGMFRVCLGVGPEAWTPPISIADGGAVPSAGAAALLSRAARPVDLPVEIDAGPGRSLVLSGPGATGIARSIVCQLAAWVGPDQLRIVFASSPRVPEWAVALPHVGPVRRGGGHHLVAVVECPELAGRAASELRRQLGLTANDALVVVDEPARTAVTAEGGRLDVGALGRGRWRSGPEVVSACVVHAAGLDEPPARRTAAAIAAIAALGTLGTIGEPPPSVTFAELAVGRDRPGLDDTIGVAAGWHTAAHGAEAWLGASADGVVGVDLDRLTGWVVVAGGERAAVDGVVATIVTSLAMGLAPAALEVVAVRSAIGGREAPSWLELPHVTRSVSIDDPAAVDDVAALLRAVPEGEPEDRRRRLLLVVDDDAAAVGSLRPALEDVRALGPPRRVHVVVATGAEPSPLARSWLDDRDGVQVVLPLTDAALARAACGDTRPCRLGRGAAVVRTPRQRARVVRLPAADDEGFAVASGAIRHAAALSATMPERSAG